MKFRGYLLILLVMLLAVLIFTSSVWAAQPSFKGIDDNGEQVGGTVYERYYVSTPTEVYQDGWQSTFQADNLTNYPYEPYLPNETAPGSYRIHSNFTKDTDACASCHATHTAVGSGLLQWYTTYETCMACHDGTVTTTYNVVTGELPDGSLAPAGMFGMGDEVSLSNHNVSGAVDTSTAPGGSAVSETAVVNGEEQVVRWGIAFGCESCHNPHGLGGNARLLHPDPNGVQIVKRDTEFSSYPLTQVGDNPVTYAAYPKTDGVVDTGRTPYYLLKTYPYSPVVVADGSEDEQAVIDNTRGYSLITLAAEPSAPDQVYATFTPALRVRMDIDNYLNQTVGDNVYEQVDYLEGMSAFCGACHTDYNTDTTDASGTYSQAYRHPVGKEFSDWQTAANLEFEETGILMCTTCHVAHGTSRDYWLRSLADEGYTEVDAVEMMGSSALKRKPNMAVCVTCHQPDASGFAHEDETFDSPSATYSQAGATYVGSETCLGCHQRYQGWQKTTHAGGMQAGTAAMLPTGEAFNTAFSGAAVSTDVLYTVGSKWRQSYLIDGGGFLQVLPKDWAPDGSGSGEFISQSTDWMYGEDTGSWSDRSFEDICAGCHTTGLADNNDTYTWEENGVSCEACHGPGSNHQNTPVDQNITNPSKLSMSLQSDLCGSCHARGRNVKNDYRSEADGQLYSRYDALGYEPGVALSVYFNQLSAAEDAGNVYYYDSIEGTIKDSKAPHQQYNDYVQSTHYQKSILSCISCHSNHDMNSEGVQLKRTAGQICSACHDTVMDLDRYMPRVTNNGTIYSRTHTFANQHPAAE